MLLAEFYPKTRCYLSVQPKSIILIQLTLVILKTRYQLLVQLWDIAEVALTVHQLELRGQLARPE